MSLAPRLSLVVPAYNVAAFLGAFLDSLAAQGLSYTRFHTTALCSPTRAAALTGRNHHSSATGVITELGTSFPGYTGQIPKSAAI